MKRKEIYTQDASAIYTTVPRLSRDLYFRETGLSKHALAKPLERIRTNAANDFEQLFSPFRFNFANIFGSVFNRRIQIRWYNNMLRLLLLVELGPPLPVEITYFIFTLNLPAPIRDRPDTPGRIFNRADFLKSRTRPCRAIFKFGLIAIFFVWNIQNFIGQFHVGRNLFREFLNRRGTSLRFQSLQGRP